MVSRRVVGTETSPWLYPVAMSAAGGLLLVSSVCLLSNDPFRPLVALLMPFLVAAMGLRKKSLDWTGAIAGYLVGFILTYANYCFLAVLLVFFVTCSKATKYKAQEKKAFEEDYKEGGQRNWIQVVCNGGVAASWAALYVLKRGPGQWPIDFRDDFSGSWIALAVLGAMGCSGGDTWASELGVVLAPPRLLTTFRPVPRGTNGGVSPLGLVFSALGGLVLGVAHYVVLLPSAGGSRSPQWPLIPTGALAGFLGSLIDSLLGATLQFSGQEEDSGRIVSRPGPGVKHISGRPLLDNHAVNIAANTLTSLLVPWLAKSYWPAPS